MSSARLQHHRRVLFGLVSGGIGGGQRVALAVARYLTASGTSVAAVAPDTGVSLDEFRHLGAPTEICGPLRSHLWPKVIRLARLMRRWDVGTVYTHTPPVQEVMLAAGARIAGARLVVHRHSFGHLSPRRFLRPIQLALWRHYLRVADEVICVSQATRDQVLRVSGRISRVVPNGVPVPPPALVSHGQIPLVACVGRLDPNKRIEDFLVGAAHVRRRFPEARFKVVGAGIPGDGYEARCRALARELGFDDREVFVGPVPRATDFLREIDVLVLPSQLEGHPIVLLEAMALGKAVVVTDIDGCRETVQDGVHGRAVPVGSPTALATAVSDLLDSPEQRARLGEAARARVVAEFSEQKMVEQIIPLVLGT